MREGWRGPCKISPAAARAARCTFSVTKIATVQQLHDALQLGVAQAARDLRSRSS